MIKCDDDMRYCQNVFACLPVADIVRRRTCKFLEKFDVPANAIYVKAKQSKRGLDEGAGRSLGTYVKPVPDVDILFTSVIV